jgi:hypothetical protein
MERGKTSIRTKAKIARPLAKAMGHGQKNFRDRVASAATLDQSTEYILAIISWAHGAMRGGILRAA